MKWTLRRWLAFLLAVMLFCTGISAFGESTTPTDLPDVEQAEDVQESESDVTEDIQTDDLTEEESSDEKVAPLPDEPTEPEETEMKSPVSPEPIKSTEETKVDPETPEEQRPLLWIDLVNEQGFAYVKTLRDTVVYQDKARTDAVFCLWGENNILFVTEKDAHVFFLNEMQEVVEGYVSPKDLADEAISEDELTQYQNIYTNQLVEQHVLFVVQGEAVVCEDETQPEVVVPPETDEEPLPEVTPDDGEVVEEPVPIPEPEPTEQPEGSTPELRTEPVESEPETTVELPVMEEEKSTHQAGNFVAVTTDTKVYFGVDDSADENGYGDCYMGVFVEDAVVEILAVLTDASNRVWYKVAYLYGDDFKDGEMKWTDKGIVYVMADDTADTNATACTVTDYAYSDADLQLMQKARFTATGMNGFSLKNISGSIGSFYAWQSGLHGSSGRDSAYPQIAKSSSHGTIYATPHYLSGYTVFCLEHNESGPGEGSGSSKKPTGPYVLVDMDYFTTNADAGGVTGVRYSARTMHALGWVLRHTYPFMVLNRSDSNNEVWSRVAGQFAMREVIKQLEGAQYVRNYWNMDSFYSFSGGAPSVYLTYARWLAENGIARASIKGKINVSNQSLNVSGNQYIGTARLTTDADLIRIDRASITLTGNSGGSDSSYYYARSGDTISITSSSNRFSVYMESVSSDDEEANFLIGIPSVRLQKVLVPLYGHPYPLQSRTLDFELSLGEIKVIKQSPDGTRLSGAVFELLNSAGSRMTTATTGATGEAVFGSLEPGSYTVRELTPPQGYTLSAASSQNVTVTAGHTSNLTFTNNVIQGVIEILKTDSLTGKPLAEATFTVTRLSAPNTGSNAGVGTVVATITTDTDGRAVTGSLPWGQYKVTETGVPEGYLDEGYSVTITIDE